MDWLIFLVFLVTCLSAGATGALFEPGAWYARLEKPRWTPPNWAFPVVWASLYILMALAATRVAGQEGSALAMALWGWQIALNTLWTPVFFGLRRMRAALFVLVGLWVAVATTMVAFWAIDPIAGALFVPYLVWVSVAAALNRSVLLRNPQEDAAARSPAA